MKVYFATDHAGFELKEFLVKYVRDVLMHEVIDLGAETLNPDDDYPVFIKKVAEAVSKDSESRGIILGGSGQGEAIVANKFNGIRAVVYYGGSEKIITLSREHNDANILSLGARFMDIDIAKKAVSLWLSTEFQNEARHVRRISQIDLN